MTVYWGRWGRTQSTSEWATTAGDFPHSYRYSISVLFSTPVICTCNLICHTCKIVFLLPFIQQILRTLNNWWLVSLPFQCLMEKRNCNSVVFVKISLMWICITVCSCVLYFQNKVFIYRGKEYERLSDFNARLQNLFPNAQVMFLLQVMNPYTSYSLITQHNIRLYWRRHTVFLFAHTWRHLASCGLSRISLCFFLFFSRHKVDHCCISETLITYQSKK